MVDAGIGREQLNCVSLSIATPRKNEQISDQTFET
jgi:hypothetical protein